MNGRMHGAIEHIFLKNGVKASEHLIFKNGRKEGDIGKRK